MTLTRVTDKIFQYAGLVGGPVVIVEDEGVCLVDAASRGEEEVILQGLTDLGIGHEQVHHLLVTHADADHVGGLPGIVEATGARVLASPAAAEVIEGRAAERFGSELGTPTPVDRRLSGREQLQVAGGIVVISTPGHCVGHLSFHRPGDSVLLAGDALMNMDGLSLGPARYVDDMAEARRSAEQLKDLAADSAVFGHGPPLVGDFSARLEALLSGQAPHS
jgi:glyoxylase-like metal-dependent hydrolase (beta-lactamase superfamily II)